MREKQGPVSPDAFRSTMSRWPSGVAVLTVLTDGSAKSALVTSLSSASLDPPLLQVGLGCGTRTHAALLDIGHPRVMISMLAEHVAAESAPIVASIEESAIAGRLDEHEAVMARAECVVYDTFPAGDHTTFLLRVCAVSEREEVRPAVYHARAFTALERADADSVRKVPSMPMTAAHNDGSAIEHEIRKWFGARGVNTTTRLEATRRHPEDFAAFAATSRLLSRTLVPADDAGAEGWSPTCAARTSVALASNGFTEWLMWHVSSLAAIPVWMSENHAIGNTYREGFERGVFGAFGMSERAAGADWRNTQSVVHRVNESYVARAQKDYAGNAQSSELVTTFARLTDGDRTSFAFFRADSRRQGYLVDRNVVPEQMYVAQFRLDGYTFGAEDMITGGDQAFADAVNTLNVGKFNLATAAVSMGRRALAETLGHTSARELFGARVRDFGQIRRGLNDAAVRLTVLQAFNDATVRSLERASSHDTSHRLMTSIAKSLVTQQAVHVIRELGDAISAKAFESESMFRLLAQYAEWLPRLEGTRYVNMMQSIRAASAFYEHLHEPRPTSVDSGPSGATYLLSQRPLGGLEDTSFAHVDLRQLPTDLDDVADHLRLVLGLSGLFVQPPPRSRGNEAAVEALAEVFTRSFLGIVGLQTLAEQGEKSDVVRRVARALTDDLLACALRSRRAVSFPPAALRVMAELTDQPTDAESTELMDIVGTISAESGL